jgi:hypothetical protein
MSRPEAPRAIRDDAPPATATLTPRRFVPGDAAKVFAMSREDGIRTWIPAQVYGHETEAGTVLAQPIAQVRDPGTPRRAPYVLAICRAARRSRSGTRGCPRSTAKWKWASRSGTAGSDAGSRRRQSGIWSTGASGASPCRV